MINNQNIILIGFMATGKSAIGELLSERLNYPLISTDDLIEVKAKMKISEIFEKFGENYFRDLETEILYSLEGSQKSIINTGGGIILRERNQKLLKDLGKVILLEAEPEVIDSRLGDLKKRPLLNILDKEERLSKIKAILADRAERYHEAADYIIDTSNLSLLEVLDKVVKYAKS